MRFAFRVLLPLILCGFLSACSSGPRKVTLTGKLNNNNEPLKVDSKGSVTVIFTPVTEKGAQFTTYTGIYRTEDTTFVVNEIPEGKYKISLQCMVPQPNKDTEDINQRFNAQNTPIVREVKGGTETLVIDLAKPN